MFQCSARFLGQSKYDKYTFSVSEKYEKKEYDILVKYYKKLKKQFPNRWLPIYKGEKPYISLVVKETNECRFSGLEEGSIYDLCLNFVQSEYKGQKYLNIEVDGCMLKKQNETNKTIIDITA